MTNNDYDPLFQYAGQKYNVDPALLRTVFRNESSENPNTPDSSAGAKGGMQMLPATFAQYSNGAPDPTDMRAAIPAAAIYLRKALDTYGSPEAALAAYHGGFDTSQWGPKTMAYVQKGIANYADVKSDMAKAAGTATPLAAAYNGPLPSPSTPPPRSPTSNTVGTPTVTQFDPDVEAGKAIMSGKPSQTAPAVDPDVAAGKAIMSRPAVSQPPAQVGLAAPPSVDTEGNRLGPIGAKPEPTGDASEAYTLPPPGSGPQPNPLTTISGAGQDVVNQATEAYKNAPTILTPGAQQWLDSTSPVVGGVVHGGNVLLGGMAAGYKGAQAAVTNAGNMLAPAISSIPGIENVVTPSALGRDIASIPDAFAGSPHTLSNAKNWGAAAPGEVVTPPPPETKTGAVNPREYYPSDSAPEPSGTPSVNEEGPSSPLFKGATKQPAPNAAGAQATPAADAAMSDKEIAAYKLASDQKMLTQPANQRAVNGVDTTQYVKDSMPTQAEYDTNSNPTQQRADLQKPEFSPQEIARRQSNSLAREDHFDNTAGTPVTTLRLEEAREANGEAALQDAWKGRIATNAQPVVDQIDSILKSPDGKQTPVSDALTQVRSKLFNNAGELEQDPQQLYGVRKQINGMLSTRYQRQNPTAADAAPQLQAIMKTLDDTIEQGAPGYQAYKSQWAADSAPIDVEKYLQGKRAGLFDSNNQIAPARVQTMMKQIVADRAARGANAAKNITDDQMSSLWDLRNDTARQANIDLGKARGSDTNQIAAASGGLLTRTLGSVGANALTAARVGTMNTIGEAIHPGLGYAANSVFETNRLLRSQAKAVQAQAAEQAAARAGLESRVSGYFAPPPGWTP